MICKGGITGTPACTVAETWEGKQARTLMAYKKQGNINALDKHLEYLRNLRRGNARVDVQFNNQDPASGPYFTVTTYE